VFEHLPEGLPRVISVGRLDLNSEGLLLFTNDGGLARALELPSSGWRRVYRARAFGRTTQAELDRLQDGITLEGVRYGPIEAKLDKAETKADGRANLWITVSLAEGKNREVRRVLEALGLKVNRLIRLAYGPFQLGSLEVGAAEEVGPRVIREQLADLIAPENLPRGDRAPAPTSKPGRRPTGEAPQGLRGSGDPLADPSRKPSRTRAQLAAARAELDSRPERAPGRAPAPERGRPGRPDKDFSKGGFRPRRDEAGHGEGERPFRSERGPRADKPFA
jgi:23S rRNA pseudouridine2605 synthase